MFSTIRKLHTKIAPQVVQLIIIGFVDIASSHYSSAITSCSCNCASSVRSCTVSITIWNQLVSNTGEVQTTKFVGHVRLVGIRCRTEPKDPSKPRMHTLVWNKVAAIDHQHHCPQTTDLCCVIKLVEDTPNEAVHLSKDKSENNAEDPKCEEFSAIHLESTHKVIYNAESGHLCYDGRDIGYHLSNCEGCWAIKTEVFVAVENWTAHKRRGHLTHSDNLKSYEYTFLINPPNFQKH